MELLEKLQLYQRLEESYYNYKMLVGKKINVLLYNSQYISCS